MSEQVNITPNTEKPKKINKLLVYTMAGMMAFAIGYMMIPSEKKVKEEPVKQEVRTSSNLGDAAKIAEVKKQQEALRAKQEGTSSQTASSGTRESAPAPIVMSEEQKYRLEKERKAEMKREAKEEAFQERRERETEQANQSGIFFNVSSKGMKEQEKPTMNDYYNASHQSKVRYVGGYQR